MPLFAESDAVQIVGMITGCITTVGMGILGYLQYRTRTAVVKGSEDTKAAVKEGTVATNTATVATAAVLGNLTTLTTATHGLVNSAMGVELRINRDQAVEKRDKNPGDEVAAAAARKAEEKYDAHMAAQAKIDAAAAKP